MDINKLKKHAPIIEQSESKTVNDFIAQGDKKPTKKNRIYHGRFSYG